MKLITQTVVKTRQTGLRPGRSRRTIQFVEEWFQPNSKVPNIQNRWARQFIYGIEDNVDLALATKVNMILHGDGNANIYKGDGLARISHT